MTDQEKELLSLLKQFGGESSVFLITNPESPWGHIADPDARTEMIQSLAGQGFLTHDTSDDIVTITDAGNGQV